MDVGAVADKVEIAELVDVDAEGRPLVVEVVVASDFLAFLTRNGGGLVLPASFAAAIDVPLGVERPTSRQ